MNRYASRYQKVKHSAVEQCHYDLWFTAYNVNEFRKRQHKSKNRGKGEVSQAQIVAVGPCLCQDCSKAGAAGLDVMQQALGKQIFAFLKGGSHLCRLKVSDCNRKSVTFT